MFLNTLDSPLPLYIFLFSDRFFFWKEIEPLKKRKATSKIGNAEAPATTSIRWTIPTHW